MGHVMMGGPGMWPTTTTQITQQNTNELAQQYADKNLAGFKVERVLPSTGMPHTMYSVELKGYFAHHAIWRCDAVWRLSQLSKLTATERQPVTSGIELEVALFYLSREQKHGTSEHLFIQ